MWFVVFLCLLARRAEATPLYIDGFDAIDAATFSSTTDVFGYELTGTDATIQAQTTLTHSAANGGGDGSKVSLRVNAAANEEAFYETCDNTDLDNPTCDVKPFPLNDNLATFGFSMHLPAAPSSTRRSAYWIETDESLGCGVGITSSRTLELFYATTSLGTGGATMFQYACAGLNEETIGCDSDDDCPSVDCSALNPTKIELWSGIEVRQESVHPSVICSIYQHGRLVAGGVPHTPSSDTVFNVTNVRFGAIGTSSTPAIDFYLDDLTVDDADRAGAGYVDRLVLTVNGPLQEWNQTGCSGTTHHSCVDDYGIGGFVFDSGDYLAHTIKNKTENFDNATPEVTYPSGAMGTALQLGVAGDAGAAGGGSGTNRKLRLGVRTCPGGVCTQGVMSADLGIGLTGVDRALVAYVWPNAPIAGSLGWSSVNAAAAGLQFATSPNHVNSWQIRAMAINLYLRVRRADTALPITIADRNKGVEDALRVIYCVGDSTAGGTFTFQCVGGERNGLGCSQLDACSWDTELDKPQGGCNGNDAVCVTCTGRRTGANGGAGYPCVADTECNHATNTCNTGLPIGIWAGSCVNNLGVGCNTTADCNALLTCDLTATCALSCPEGECPLGRGGWPDFVQDNVGVNALISCPQGGERAIDMVENRLTNILDGTEITCSLIAGTKRCSCSTNADCDPSGLCTGGICTTSTGNRISCTVNGDCAGGQTCRLPKPDMLILLEGYNDSNAAHHDPNCTTWLSSWVGKTPATGRSCSCATRSLCTSHADCVTAVGTGSLCLGIDSKVGFSDRYCNSTAFCTAFLGACNDASDCGAGATCTINDPTGCLFTGTCQCGAGNFCPTSHVCRNNICFRDCTSDSQCVSTISGSCDTGASACKGMCTCPSSSITCATDADCIRTYYHLPYQSEADATRTARGNCVATKCECTGPSSWFGTSTCRNEYETDFYQKADHAEVARQWHIVQSTIDALGESTAPTMVVSTIPEFNQFEGTCGTDLQYIFRANAHLLAEFPRVVDAAEVRRSSEIRLVTTDFVHYSVLGAALVGREIGEFVGSYGACSTNVDTAAQAPQHYCRQTNGTFTSTICTVANEATDCTPPDRCEIKPCTVEGDCPSGGDTCNIQ